MRSLRYEPSASVCALMVATPGLVGWSRIRPLVGEPSRAALGAAGAAPKTRDGGDFGGSTAGGGAGAITPPGMESQLRVLPDAFEPPGRHGSSLGTEPQLRVLPVASDPPGRHTSSGSTDTAFGGDHPSGLGARRDASSSARVAGPERGAVHPGGIRTSLSDWRCSSCAVGSILSGKP